MIRQSTFLIPIELEAGLRSGDLIQWGGIVRNQAGQIVKHLKEIDLPPADEKAGATVVKMFKNPKVIIGSIVVGALATGAAVAATARKRKQSAGRGVPEPLANYNAALAAYLEAVREGRLDADIIDRLISALDLAMTFSEADGNITLDFSSRQAQMLVKLVLDSTRQLAEENSLELDELHDQELPPQANVIDLRRHLEVQLKIFGGAA